MKIGKLLKTSAASALAFAAFSMSAYPLAAQSAEEPAGEFTPKRAQQYSQVTSWPDFTGVWAPDLSFLFGGSGRLPARPVLTPEGQAKLTAFLEKQERDGVDQYLQENCIPTGMPGIMRQPYPIEFLYTPGRVTIFTETYSQARRLYVDGRALPEDPDPFFNGSSVARWEGDMLVVDTIGFSPLVSYLAGIEPSEKTQIHEHIWLTDDNYMMVETTITDPENLAQPFVRLAAFRREADWEIREYVCAENNRLRATEDGSNIDLGFDDEDDPFGPPLEE